MKLTLYAWAAAIALGVASAKCDPTDTEAFSDCVAATVGILITCADMGTCTGAPSPHAQQGEFSKSSPAT